MAKLRLLDFVRLLGIPAIAALAGALAHTAALASFPGGDGVIAYSHEGRIWAVEPHTSNQLQLTSGPGDSAPSFSPSGDLLAFQRLADGSATVYLARADGSDARPLVVGSEPDFSPNGREIVLVRQDGLFMTDLTPGGPVRQLTDHPGDHHPRWGANGSIVFQRTDVWHRVVTCIRNGNSDSATELLLEHGARYCKNGNARREDLLLRRSDLDIITPPSLRIRQIVTYRAQLSTRRPSSETVEMYPDWSPDGRAVAAALCYLDSFGGPGPVLDTVPSIVFRESCSPAVWAPAGRQLVGPPEGPSPVLLVAGPLPGMKFTACPEVVEGLLAWQPLVDGTLRVPTVKCEERPTPLEPRTETSPGEVISGGHLCTYFPRRHRTICTTTR
jgi:WD40-like Beta Propeller Repeat